MVDPGARLLEIVTGTEVRRVLDDGEVKLAAPTMQTAFASGDLVGGITRVVHQLAGHARCAQLLHSDTP